MPSPRARAGARRGFVRLHAAGVYFSDTERRRGVYDPPALPWIPGNEAAGVVEALGSGVVCVGSFWLAADPPERWDTARRELPDWIAGGTLRVTIARIFPLEEAAMSHEQLESRDAHGKLVLSTGGSQANRRANRHGS